LKTCLLISSLVFFLWSCQSGKTENAIKPAPQAPVIVLSDEEKQKYHDIAEGFLDSTLLRGKFNGSILVAKKGVPVYEKYIGVRDFREKDSLTPSTAFQIASTSKPFTAAAVLKLVEEGKLELNTLIADIFPGFPYQEVTVKMLLNHRSGLPNYLHYMEHGGWDRKKLATNLDVLNTLIEWKPNRAYRPDTKFNYCNTNYVLLALIVEKVSGVSFPQYMERNFFEPFGMHDTYVHTIEDSARIAPSYDGRNTLWALDFSDGPYGDKNIYSTPRDLLKWDQAWYKGQVLSQALTDSAFTAYSNERPSQHNYGLGWRLLMLPNNKKVVYHNGRWHGFNSSFARLTDEQVTIIILGNKFNSSVYNIARKFYNRFGPYDGKGEEGEE
jgi:CubicO group peptidase (beta-lactamase class C family)